MIVVSMALTLALSQAPAEASPQAPAATEAAPPQQGTLAPAPPAPASAPAGQPLTLEDALAAAAERNLDLRAARARLRQADELSWKAWSGYLPQLTAQGAYTYNQYAAEISLPTDYYVRDSGTPQGPPTNDPSRPTSPENPPGSATPFTIYPSAFQTATIQEQNQLAGQAELTQAILAPRLWFLIPNASRGEKVAALTVDGVRRDVLFGVAQAFYGVASLRQALQVSERLLEIAQRSERDARVRFQAGTVAKVALLRAEIDRARAEQDLLRARNSYDSSKLALANLLDRAPDFEVVDPPEPDLPADTGSLEEIALRSRPDVQAARLQVDVERGNRSAAIARYLPNVGAFARYQISNSGGFTGESDQYAVGVGLSWQILDGGLRESDIREGGARIAEAEASAASAENRVRLEVRQALLDLESARANAVKAKEQRELAAENQRLVDVSYRAGAATAIEQADATAQLRTAEIAATAEALGAQLAALRVLKAAGEFEPRARRR
jgi:outer membrane protein TolC